jgi:23S rRNA (guanosine2251-2'-O)-methyltransferase
LRIPVVEVEGGTLTSIAGFDGHQGIALVTDARTWGAIDDVLAKAATLGEAAFVLVLDSLEDPQNMGTLLRAAEAAGVHGVLFPTRRAAPLTPAAVKASAGAVEHLVLVPLDDLPGALADLHLRGLRIVGAEAEAALSHRDADLRGPLALVVGSEGHGLGAAVRRRLDLSVRIPMRGRVGSLNAAVAGSILLFEAAGQRDLPAREPSEDLPAREPTAAAAAQAPTAAAESEPPVEEPRPEQPVAESHVEQAAEAAPAKPARRRASTRRATAPKPEPPVDEPRPEERVAEATVEQAAEAAPAKPARRRASTRKATPAAPEPSAEEPVTDELLPGEKAADEP